MGYIRHDTTIVTGGLKEHGILARAKAVKMLKGLTHVSPLSTSRANGYWSFCIFPDGSKEGWQHSTDAEKAHDDFISWLRERREDEDPIYADFAHIKFGGDDVEAYVVDHNKS